MKQYPEKYFTAQVEAYRGEFWLKIKLMLFGEKIVEYWRGKRSVMYFYNNKIYITELLKP